MNMSEDFYKAIIKYLVAIFFILLLWELASRLLASDILPGPEVSITAFGSAIKTRDFWDHFIVSSIRVISAMLIGFAVAFPLGILMGSSKKVDEWLAPLIFLTYPIPKIVLLPIVLILFGLGNSSKIILISLIIGYQILVATRDGVLNINSRYIDSIRSLGANRFQILRDVIVPAALPYGFTALRLSTGTSVAVLFFVESFGTTNGLGYLIMDSWGRLAYKEMFVGIIGMSILGVLLYETINILENWFCAWKYVEKKDKNLQIQEQNSMIREQIKVYGRLIKFSHTIFALPFALSAIVLAYREHSLTFWTFFWTLIAIVAARSAAMGFNRFIDYEYDRLNPRTSNRPLVSGKISKRAVIIFILISSFVFILSTLMLSKVCFALSIPLLLVLLSYSYTKRFTPLSHLYLGFAISLAPIGAWLAITGTIDKRIFILSFALMTYIAGFDILYACQDIEFDRKTGLFSIPAMFGIQRALLISTFMHILSFGALLTIYFVFKLEPKYLFFMLLIGGLLVLEHRLVRPDNLDKINVAFFHVNSAISVMLFIAIWASI